MHKDPKELEKERIKNYKSKEIIALTDFEHCLARPTMYIGSVEQSDERVQIVEVDENGATGRVFEKTKVISVGFYKMLNEIVDNAFDEAKRSKVTSSKIRVEIDSKSNQVKVSDTGGGFINAEKANSKTGLSNVETALSMLRAGSNFYNEGSTDTLIGTNGVGAALVNMLSEEFEVHTVNSEVDYLIRWKRFVKAAEEHSAAKGQSGTVITYIPRKDIFKGCQWDREYLHTMFVFRQFLLKRDPLLQNVQLEFVFDGEKLDLELPFLPEKYIEITSDIGVFFLWEGYANGTSTSFINGANCNGIHQKVMQDWINEMFDYPQAHFFYGSFFVLNLPPKMVKFADQNKTRYAGGRWEIQPLLEKKFYGKLKRSLPGSEIFKSIRKRIDERNLKQDLNNIKAKKRAATKKISDKYFPPSQAKGTLFIVEGGSAMGSILQKRDPRTDGVYSLKGKIKNARTVRDLGTNAEIIDLMNILNLEPGNGKGCTFANVAIATDWDPDGIGHIASLVINLFYKWFPQVIDDGRLNILITPLVSIEEGKQRKYFYSLEDFGEYEKSGKPTRGVRYLKGLGSLSIQDWERVMGERTMFRIKNDRSAGKYIDIAFGLSSGKRKRWLEGQL
jgi:DNA gyrase/topoisomerase IV subunit B